jgi:hypothetical protein
MNATLSKVLNGISEQVGTFLPNIAAAIGVLVLGWILAKVLGRVAKIAVKKTGVDQHIAGLLGTDRRTDMSSLIGKIVYYIGMLFVFVAFFNVLDLPVVSQPLTAFLNRIFDFAPQAISSLVLALIAWGLATIGRLASRRVLETLDVDARIASIGKDVSTMSTTAGRAVTNAANLNVSASRRESTFSQPDDVTEEVLEMVDDVADDRLSFQQEALPADEANVSFQDRGVSLEEDNVSLSKSLPEAVYWLILFTFLPAILGTLNMPGLLEPIQGMFEKAFNYLPNLFGAAIILAIGFFVAKIVRQIVANLTSSLGVDRLSQRLGMSQTSGGTKISSLIGVVAYASVLLPVIVAALNTLNIDAVTRPASAVLQQITDAIPGLIGGAVVLAVSYFVAKMIGGVVTELLGGIGFDQTVGKLGLISTSKLTTAPSVLAGNAVLVVVMILATMQALPMMGLEMFAGHLEQFIGFATQVIVGLILIGLGIYLANLASRFIRESGVQGSQHLSTIARVAIMVFAGAMGLERMGLSSSIVNVAFGSLLGGLGLASAIAFGWGGRDAAKRLIDRYVD